MELKNTTRELREGHTSINSQINQAEERISAIEDQLNEIKHEDNIREEKIKTPKTRVPLLLQRVATPHQEWNKTG